MRPLVNQENKQLNLSKMVSTNSLKERIAAVRKDAKQGTECDVMWGN